jgi:hypothetical protein
VCVGKQRHGDRANNIHHEEADLLKGKVTRVSAWLYLYQTYLLYFYLRIGCLRAKIKAANLPREAKDGERKRKAARAEWRVVLSLLASSTLPVCVS